jgi:hypothetical protein
MIKIVYPEVEKEIANCTIKAHFLALAICKDDLLIHSLDQ